MINIDSFFEQSETGPGRTVMQDESAKTRYTEKRGWQWIHKALCTASSAMCGDNEAIFRSRSTGAWSVTGRFTSAPVSYEDNIDQQKLTDYVAAGKDFLPSLSVRPIVHDINNPPGSQYRCRDCQGNRVCTW